jgi:DNA-3-methyladenine glycosylase II
MNSMNTSAFSTLNERTYKQGIAELVRRDRHLQQVVLKWGSPPFWTHPPGYPGIVLSILSQQVSLESAHATFVKLNGLVNDLDPHALLSLDDKLLKAAGLSRQKMEYVRGVAREIAEGRLDLNSLQDLGNGQVLQSLTAVRGIGAWTAGTYLLFALRRADAWPSGDLALIKAVQELKGLETLPGSDEVDEIAANWKPWRAVAARILWHHYLRERGRASTL